MKKKYFYYIFIAIILIFAFLIRLNNLDKIQGLWYDEITIYSIAAKKSILLSLNEDAHRFLLFPLYYLVYKLWLAIFGNSDYVIRLMSVFFDMAAIVCTYFVGTNFASLLQKDDVKEKIGVFTMLLYAINSSFIYYAQEAKFYSMTFFLVNILLIFWSKFLKTPNKKNTVLFLISNAILLYTYASQILLLLSIQIVTLAFFLHYKKDEIKVYINQFFGWLITLIPLFLIMLSVHKYFSGNFDAVLYDNSFILLVLQNYFSPILVGLQNNLLLYQYSVLINIFNLKWIIFVFFPVIFNIVLIIKSCKKEIFPKLFVSVVLLYLCFHIALTVTPLTAYKVMVRYTLPALPLLIVVCANGFEVLCRKRIGYILLALFLLVNLSALNSPVGATKIQRPQSYKGLADALISAKISPNSNFIFPMRISLLDKYYYVKGQRYSLYTLNTEDCKKTYLNPEEIEKISRKKDLYGNYKRFLLSEKISKDFENYIVKNYTSNNSKDLVIIEDRGISPFSDEKLSKIIKSGDKVYKTIPIQFLRLSKLENNLLKVLSKNMKLKQSFTAGSWQIYVFSAR